METKYIRLKFLEDFRVFKAGEVIEFKFPEPGTIIFVTGKNGSGKSTFANAVRMHKEDTIRRDVYGCDIPLNGDSLNYSFSEELKAVTKLETNFKKILHTSSEWDDPSNHNNAYDASSYISMGGFITCRNSSGEKQQYVADIFLKNNKESIDEDTLLIFDEFETKMDMELQSMLILDGYKNLAKKRHGCFLVITHSPFALFATDEIYDFKARKFVSTVEYFKHLLRRDTQEKENK